MTKYLVAIHRPNDYDPFVEEDEAMAREIDTLNDEMEAAGVRIFVGGLKPASTAKSLRRQPDGEVSVTDGHYLETTEHGGGVWVLAAADLDEALAWGRKAAGVRRGAAVSLTDDPASPAELECQVPC